MERYIELKITFKNGIEKVYLMDYIEGYNSNPSTVPNSVSEFANKEYMFYGFVTKDNISITANIKEILFIESKIIEQ